MSKTLIEPTSDGFHRAKLQVEYSIYSKFLILLFSITLILRIAFHLTDFGLRLAHNERA